MRDIIKFLIALTFIIGAFYVGKYMGSEESESKIKKMNEDMVIKDKNIRYYQDSLYNLQKEITILKFKKQILNSKQNNNDLRRKAY